MITLRTLSESVFYRITSLSNRCQYSFHSGRRTKDPFDSECARAPL